MERKLVCKLFCLFSKLVDIFGPALRTNDFKEIVQYRDTHTCGGCKIYVKLLVSTKTIKQRFLNFETLSIRNKGQWADG